MKRLILILSVLMLFPLAAMGQYVINGYDAPPDSSYWAFFSVGSSDTSHIDMSFDSTNAKFGAASMRLDWTVQASESWGGFTNIRHFHPDSGGVYDLSPYTHLSFWYNNINPSSQPTMVEFRIILHDVSDSPAQTVNDVDNTEFWYSHIKILDDQPGWHEVMLPLRDMGGQLDREGFWLPGWAGIGGNGKLDLDKIKGWTFEFSIDGTLHNPNDPQSSGIAVGSILLDQLAGVGHRYPVVNLFDHAAGDTSIEFIGTGTSVFNLSDVTENAFEDTSLQIQWKVDADQSFGGFGTLLFHQNDFLPDMSASTHLSLWYNNLVPPSIQGNVVFRMELHDYSEGPDQEEVWYYETNVVLDSEPGWKRLLIPLEDRGPGQFPNNQGFSRPGWAGVAGNDTLDWDKVKDYAISISAAQQGTITEGTLLVDRFELYGVRETDFTPPVAPEGVSAVPDVNAHFNLVIWQDVPGEEGEKYDVFASTEPITDVNAPGVEMIAAGIPEGTQTFTHYLLYPLQDKEMTYYYAVRATDKAGNVGDPGVMDAPVTNTAVGVATIALNPPANFVADGDFTEWENSGIKPFVLSPSTAHIATGTFDGDDDLTATIYMAIDDQYLYIAADVIDDVHSFDPAGNWWEDDALELFIGLYEGRPGPKHNNMQRGEEPDYKLQIRNDALVNEYAGNVEIFTPDSADYYFEGFGSDYAVEARIPLTSIQFGDDKPFVPVNGMRVPMDFNVHDSDAPNTRDGVISYSWYNMDNSWQSPRNWSYTWIGDRAEPTAVEENGTRGLPRDFALRQNYPNPFNPTTTIEYDLPKSGHVKMVLYNTLGQQVRTLFDGVKAAGSYKLHLTMDNLPSGVYFYQIIADGFKATRKLVLMK